MKKIGIATYIKSYNYGSVLQAFALSKHIETLGYSVALIDFLDLSKAHNKKMKAWQIASRFKTCLLHPRLLIDEYRRIKTNRAKVNDTNIRKKQLVDLFCENNLVFSEENYFDKGKFDAFVCGSDQIWKTTVPGLHPFFFLRFTERKKRISYAPSFGSDTVPCYNKRLLKKYLKEMNYLSVREESGVMLIKEIAGIEAEQVLDPVILVEPEFWRTHYRNSPEQEDYILCYFLDSNKQGQEAAIEIAQKIGMKIIDISDSNAGCDYYPDPIGFVQLIDNAKIVLTDSFHGLAFSAEMNTPFCVFNRNYSSSSEQKTRISSFLNLIDCKERYYEENITLKMDFSTCNTILANERKKSQTYLKDSLIKALA